MKAIDENAEVVEETSEEEDDDDDESRIRRDGPTPATDRKDFVLGVLYGRSVRSGYACLHLYCPPSLLVMRAREWGYCKSTDGSSCDLVSY